MGTNWDRYGRLFITSTISHVLEDYVASSSLGDLVNAPVLGVGVPQIVSIAARLWASAVSLSFWEIRCFTPFTADETQRTEHTSSSPHDDTVIKIPCFPFPLPPPTTGCRIEGGVEGVLLGNINMYDLSRSVGLFISGVKT